MDALERFNDELIACGVTGEAVRMLCRRYGRALRTASARDWEGLYRDLFGALGVLSERGGSAAAGGAALESVMRILEDDLGHHLFGANALAALRARLDDARSLTASR